MAITITKLKMWKDPHYTRGCLEVPPAGSKKLPAPDWSSAAGETLRPRKGSTITAVELPLSYSEVFGMSYLYMEAEDASGTIKLFGWIDTVTLISTSEDAVRIEWSVDWWRSFSDAVTFGAGRISRCGDASRKRPIGIQPRYRTAADVAEIKSPDGHLYVIISYRLSTSQRTLLIIPCAPDGHSEGTINIGHLGAEILHETAPSPSLVKCMSGALPSLLGIESASIDGAWISPINPLNEGTYQIFGNTFNCHYQDYSLQKGTTYGAIKCVGFNAKELSILPYKSIDISTSALKTTDLVTYAISDNYGNVVGSAPYDLSFSQLTCTLDIGNISATLKVTFNVDTGTLGRKTSEGMTVTIPLPSVPISSSAYSDYVYSGQRDYEMNLRSLQNKQQAVHGLSGAITGAATGAVLGSVVPGAGTAAGAVVGALTGLASAGVNYAVDESIYKDKFQDLEDDRYSNQTGNLMIAGDGFGWLLFNKYPKLISLTADKVFQSELANHILQEGYPCDSPVSDVTSFITAGGAIQIFNLTITGACPPVAKRTIKSLLEGGIRIIERNPSGVVP